MKSEIRRKKGKEKRKTSHALGEALEGPGFLVEKLQMKLRGRGLDRPAIGFLLVCCNDVIHWMKDEKTTKQSVKSRSRRAKEAKETSLLSSSSKAILWRGSPGHSNEIRKKLSRTHSMVQLVRSFSDETNVNLRKLSL